jgi:hypothetical protein
MLLASTVGKGDQRTNGNTLFDRLHQGPLDLRAIKAKNDNLDALLSLANAFHELIDAIAGLDQ